MIDTNTAASDYAPRMVQAPELMDRLERMAADQAAQDAHDQAVDALVKALHSGPYVGAALLEHAWNAFDGYANLP